MATLYALKEEYMALLSFAEDGELDEQAFLDTLDGLQGEIDEKLESCQIVRKSLQADAEMFAAEVARLNAIVARLKRKDELLKSRMQEMVDLLPDKKTESKHFKFSIVKNGGKLPLFIDVEDISLLPDKFKKVTITADSESIRAELDKMTDEERREFRFAHYGERGTRLAVK